MDKNGKKPAFDHRVLESGWRKKWQEQGLYRTDISGAKKPYYNLMMYPYPSAEGLHVGNMYAFTGSDIWGRYMRMRGYDVFEPIGVDSGGIHSENFAIKMGAHPKKMTAQNISNFVKQLHKIGNMYDWEHFVDAMDPSYYRGTQWLFVQLFKAGLAEKKKSIVTWCPSCKTTLSDEQTEMTDDRVICERCKTPVEKRQMKQWFFKITKYADRLLNNLPQLDWTPKVKLAQQNWIGRTYGIEIKYDIVLSDPRSKSVKRSWIEKPAITCFTTRPDTNFGATFIVAAPEHRIVQEILNPKSEIRNKFQISNDQITQITKYIEKTKSKSEQERIAEGREKTGVFTGLYAINQLNGKKLPIWISDFVLGHVGTGAVVGVPGHDKRDFEFAQKFGLEIIRVVVAKDGDTTPITSIEQVQEQEGTMINSGFLNGLDIHQATTKIMDYLEQKGWGKRKTAYKLRDWCISRQRYWGPPIPMIFCPNCAEKGLSWHTTEEAKSRRQFSNTGCWKSLTPGVLLGGANSQLDNLTIRNYAGYYPVPESELPVILPDIDDYLPDGSGKAPLARHPEFFRTKCPGCGGPAERETDVSDTFLDSAWYFLRYPSVDLNKKLKIINKIDNQKYLNSLSARGGSTFGGKIENCKLKISNSQFDNLQFAIPWNREVTRGWLPVNKYIGGAEHSVLHLMYSRFITMVMYDLGYLSFEEPFTSFYAHGLLIKDGAKMSKSKGNVVNPDEYIDRFGADALRCYLMFLGPLSGGGDFRDAGMQGMRRFLQRVYNLVNNSCKKLVPSEQSESRDALYHRHSTIKRVTEGIERYKYNTSIAALMEWVNWLEDKIGSPPSKTPGVKDFQHPVLENWRRPKSKQGRSMSLGKDRPLPDDLRTLLLLLAPFAPYMTEELWSVLHNSSNSKSEYRNPKHPPAGGQNSNFPISKSIHAQKWPEYEEKYLEQDEVEIIVQVNGKLRDRLKAKSDKLKAKEEIIERAKKLPKIQTYFRSCHPELACPPKRGVSGSDFKIQKAIYIEGKLVNLVV